MKESYERTEIEIIRFRTDDVIMTTSEYEGWNPNNPVSGDEYEGWKP